MLVYLSFPSLSRTDVLFGFLAYQFPCHVALTSHQVVALDEAVCSTRDILLELARRTHQLVALLPLALVLELEKEELLWEQKGTCCWLEHIDMCIHNHSVGPVCLVLQTKELIMLTHLACTVPEYKSQ